MGAGRRGGRQRPFSGAGRLACVEPSRSVLCRRRRPSRCCSAVSRSSTTASGSCEWGIGTAIPRTRSPSGGRSSGSGGGQSPTALEVDGRETLGDLNVRVAGALDELVADLVDGRVAVVFTHDAVVRAAVAWALGTGPEIYRHVEVANDRQRVSHLPLSLGNHEPFPRATLRRPRRLPPDPPVDPFLQAPPTCRRDVARGMFCCRSALGVAHP